MSVSSPRPDDQWMTDQLEACRRAWPEHHGFRIEQEGKGPLCVFAIDSHELLALLVSIDHPEAWSLLASMLWGS